MTPPRKTETKESMRTIVFALFKTQWTCGNTSSCYLILPPIKTLEVDSCSVAQEQLYSLGQIHDKGLSLNVLVV